MEKSSHWNKRYEKINEIGSTTIHTVVTNAEHQRQEILKTLEDNERFFYQGMTIRLTAELLILTQQSEENGIVFSKWWDKITVNIIFPTYLNYNTGMRVK